MHETASPTTGGGAGDGTRLAPAAFWSSARSSLGLESVVRVVSATAEPKATGVQGPGAMASAYRCYWTCVRRARRRLGGRTRVLGRRRVRGVRACPNTRARQGAHEKETALGLCRARSRSSVMAMAVGSVLLKACSCGRTAKQRPSCCCAVQAAEQAGSKTGTGNDTRQAQEKVGPSGCSPEGLPAEDRVAQAGSGAGRAPARSVRRRGRGDRARRSPRLQTST